MITIGSIGSIGKRRSATAAILISERLSYDETTINKFVAKADGDE